jgi:hypothetical protein
MTSQFYVVFMAQYKYYNVCVAVMRVWRSIHTTLCVSPLCVCGSASTLHCFGAVMRVWRSINTILCGAVMRVWYMYGQYVGKIPVCCMECENESKTYILGKL